MKVKKVILSLLAFAATTCLSLGFTACEKGNSNSSDHEHSYSSEVVDPTCTQNGYTLHECSCGKSYTDTETPLLGHSWGEYISDENATCTNDGTETASCTRTGCGETDSRTEANSKLGHTYDRQIEDVQYLKEEATCTQKGVYYKSCVCGLASELETFEGEEFGDHPKAVAWSYTATHHWHETTCDCDEDLDYGEHELDETGHCEICGRLQLAEEVVDFIVEVPTGRNVRILQLSDTQIIDPGQKRYEDRIPSNVALNDAALYDACFRYIESAVEQANPDLILLTGDIVYGEFDDDGHIFQAIVSFIDSLEIYWAPVYGNHDNESQKGVTWQNQQFLDAEYCLFKKGDVTGNGNYTIGIKQGNELVKVIYMMDSNGCGAAYSQTYTDKGQSVTITYNENEQVKTSAGFATDQMQWLSDTASLIKTLTGGEVSSFLACHIPIGEFADAAYQAGYQSNSSLTNSETYKIGVDKEAINGDFGSKGEIFKGAYYIEGLWDILKENGFDGFFCGHSHCNNVSILYDGIRLTFGLKSSTYDRYTANELGGTMITLKADKTFTVEHVYYEMDFSEFDYDFSSVNDDDQKAVISKGSGLSHGIVSDALAEDGYALKGVSAVDSNGSGLTVLFSDKDISKYERIVLRLRVEQGSAVSVDVNGVYVNYISNTSYIELDVIEMMKNNTTLQTETYLKSISVYRKLLSKQTFYVDCVKFYEKTDFSRINYDFSSANDYDLETTRSINNATTPAIVQVAGASDGWAVYCSISHDGGLKIVFGGIDVSKYSQIIVRVKTTANVNLNINDTYCDWPIYSDFTEVNLIPYMQSKNLGTTLNSVSFTRNVSYQIWIDSITFVEKAVGINYDFSSEEDVDLTTANKINNATAPAMVQVAGASDGWAVYCSISHDGGLKIVFDGIDVSKYSQIIVRVKTTANVDLKINDTYCDWPIYSEFTEVDLIAYMQSKELGTTLNSVSFTRNVTYQIWIDSITFVPAE